MLKLLGGALVLFASTMLGFYVSRQYANRPKQIRQLLHALQRLETEIAYGLTPLPTALRLISKQTAEPLQQFFLEAAERLNSEQSTTAAAWEKAVNDHWKRTALKEAEKEVVLQLGRNLGSSNSGDQQKHLHLAMGQLTSEEEAATEEQRKYEKMWKSLGWLGGALVVIMLY